MGVGCVWRRGGLRLQYTNPAMPESLKFLSIRFISARSLREKPQSVLGGRGVVEGEQREKSDLSPGLGKQETRVPDSTGNIYVATASDEFLHFGTGQSESSRTIYRNFEMENTWSMLLKMQETHF